MKFVFLCLIFLTGCATNNNYSIYADANKSLSKDSTMSEIACYNAITETMRMSESAVKLAAIKIISQCKKPQPVIQLPK